MVIQPGSAAVAVQAAKSFYGGRQTTSAPAANSADTVSISQAARDALASSPGGTDAAVTARLKEIEAKDPLMGRTAEDMDFLWSHDPRLTAIRDKVRSGAALTAEEIDGEQKAIGFVNTMASLSPQEKRMYDEMVAAGDSEAAAGMSQIAFLRATMGHMAGGANGTTYDPINTGITADNVARYFMHSFVDPSGKTSAQFEALASYLENRSSDSSTSTARA